jgi:NAD(P)-dependent dehydrogenase (short-subunit alcohol dehydrogenase family)
MAESSAVDEAKERGLSIDDIWRERAAVNPANRIVTPGEVGAMIAFLASEKASAVNGQAVTMALGGLN